MKKILFILLSLSILKVYGQEVSQHHIYSYKKNVTVKFDNNSTFDFEDTLYAIINYNNKYFFVKKSRQRKIAIYDNYFIEQVTNMPSECNEIKNDGSMIPATIPDLDNILIQNYFQDSAPDLIINKTKKLAVTEKYMFEYKNKPNFILGVSYSPMLAYRMLLVNNPFFSDEQSIVRRQMQEKALLGHLLSPRLGLLVKKNHQILLEPSYMLNGFKINQNVQQPYSNINTQTGLPDTTNKLKPYQSIVVALGYRYSPYKGPRTWNFACEGFGYYRGFLSNSTTTNKNAVGIKGGIGIVYRPRYRHEIFGMLTGMYDFTPVINGSELKTRLYNLGVSVGYSLNLFQKNK